MGYIVIEAAGKWPTSNCITITEVESDVSLSVPSSSAIGVSGFTTPYWNRSIWDRSKLVDGNKNYTNNSTGSTSSAGFNTGDGVELNTDSFVRFAIPTSGTPNIVKVFAGSPEGRIPKQISVYYGDTIDITTNLTNRGNSGLNYWGTQNISSSQTTVDEFDFPVRTETGIFPGAVIAARMGLRSKINVSGAAIIGKVGSRSKVASGAVVINKAGSRSKNIIGIKNPFKPAGARAIVNSQGMKLIPLTYVATRPHRTLPGVATTQKPGVRVKVNQGILIKTPPGIRQARIFQGLYLQVLRLSDSGAGSNIQFLVTPTFTLEGSAIEINAKNISNPIKMELYINSTLEQTFTTALSDLIFNVNLDWLIIGNNTGRLKYYYADGTQQYVDFIITGEDNYRTSSSRTLKTYTGGFSLESKVYRLKDGDKQAFAASAGSDATTGVVTTTDLTAFDLSKDKGIGGLTAVGEGCQFLISFDGRQTWHYFDGTNWNACAPADIATYGMTASALAAITSDQWLTIFQKTQLDVMIYLDPANSNYSSNAMAHTLYRSGTITNTGEITVYPPDTVNKISKVHADWWGTYYYNSQMCYVNSTAGTHTYMKQQGGADYEIQQPEECINYVTFDSYNGETNNYAVYTKSLVAYIESLTLNLVPNYAPVITNVVLTPSSVHTDDATLTAHIKDPEGDTTSYRILVNGVPLEDYIAVSGEFDISVQIPNISANLGTNSVTVQAYDGTSTKEYTTYITKVDEKPAISGVLEGRVLTATISDPDSGDTVSYRIILNGGVLVDWTEFAAVPQTINYVIPKEKIKIAVQNTLTLEAKDNVQQITAAEFDFVGVSYGNYVFIM